MIKLNIIRTSVKDISEALKDIKTPYVRIKFYFSLFVWESRVDGAASVLIKNLFHSLMCCAIENIKYSIVQWFPTGGSQTRFQWVARL